MNMNRRTNFIVLTNEFNFTHSQQTSESEVGCNVCMSCTARYSVFYFHCSVINSLQNFPVNDMLKSILDRRSQFKITFTELTTFRWPKLWITRSGTKRLADKNLITF